jgi:hypothetical protein
LTPSELVFLHADQFVKAAGMLDAINIIGRVELLHKQASVQAMGLSRVLLTTALLAAAQSGDVSLQIGHLPGLLAFLQGDTVLVSPATGPDQWPKGSLEQRFIQATRRAGTINLSRLVYEVLERKDVQYYHLASDLVKAGLAERNLLIREQRSMLLVLKTTSYRLPDATRRLADSLPLQPVQQLLWQTEQNDPRFWRLLQKAIEKGTQQRKDDSPTE